MSNLFNDAAVPNEKSNAATEHLGNHNDLLRMEAYACESKSAAPHAKFADLLEASTRKAKTSALGLPDNASDRDVCLKQGEVSLTDGERAVSRFAKAISDGDTKEVNKALLDLSNISDPLIHMMSFQAADTALKNHGIGHSWDKQEDLTLFKDHGSASDLIHFTGLDMSATRLNRNPQGQIQDAHPEAPSEALHAILNKQ